MLVFRQKQPFANVLQNNCFQKFRKFHWKTPVLESLFSKFAGLRPAKLLKKLKYRCFPVKFVKFLRTPFLQSTSNGCFFRCFLIILISSSLIINVNKLFFNPLIANPTKWSNTVKQFVH